MQQDENEQRNPQQRDHRLLLTRRGVILGGLGLVGLPGSTTAAYAAAVEPYGLRITDYRLSPPGLPPDFHLTISVIADLHAGGPNMGHARVRQVVDASNQLKSDLVVVLGDYFATHRFITERVTHAVWSAELARLNAPLGVWSIYGNHDWWFDIEGTRRAMQAARLPVLENGAVLLGSGKKEFWLAGLGDQLAHPLGHGHFRGVDDLRGTLWKIRGNAPVILLAHEPDIFVQVPDRVSLTLAGHTHGGQIRIPYVWTPFVPSAYGERFAYGHIVEGGRHMVVSGGLGTSLIPARLGVPPEIVRITLTGA